MLSTTPSHPSSMTPLAPVATVFGRTRPGRACQPGGKLDVCSAQWPPAGQTGDFVELSHGRDGSTTIVMGDVCGNGRKAAPVAARTSRMFREQLAGGSSLGSAMTAVSDALDRELDEDLFVTAVAARIHPSRRSVQVVSAGHLGPFVRRGSGAVLAVSQPGAPPLSLLSAHGYDEVHFALQPRDVLLFATDGVSDQFASAGDRSGQEGLLRQLAKLPSRPAALCRRLLWTASPATDVDATVLAVQIDP